MSEKVSRCDLCHTPDVRTLYEVVRLPQMGYGVGNFCMACIREWGE